MKHNKIISTLAVAAAALCCLAGCEKDKTTQTLQIITPGFENESNQKVYLENTKPTWNAGVDQVRINTTQVCTVTYNGTRYEVNPNPANAYYAPAVSWAVSRGVPMRTAVLLLFLPRKTIASIHLVNRRLLLLWQPV